MKKATSTGPAADPSQIVCECGGDHRGTDTRRCPIFNILKCLNGQVREFLDFQDVLEFGKDGPMAHCLQDILLKEYDAITKEFQKREAMSKEHPEWQLADEILRLRRYFEQVADGCAEDKKTFSPRPPPSVIPTELGETGPLMGSANSSINYFYDICCDVLSEFVLTGAESWRILATDEEGFLAKIDDKFKESFEVVVRLPKTENATIQDLTKKLYDIWRECQRLLCEFERPLRYIVPV